jgi:hypothetical protein
MYPSSLQLIQYNGRFLGTSNSIFGFVKPTHVKYIVKNMKYENMRIIKSSNNCFLVKPQSLKKPLNRKLLKMKSFDTSVGHYFTSINNMNMKIIDSISHNKTEDSFELHSNYTIDFDVDDEMQKYHLDLIYNSEKIDYSEEYNNMLLLSFMEFNEEDYL